MATDSQQNIKKYEDLLKRSKTSYNPTVKPTEKDIQAQTMLMKAEASAEKLKSDDLKKKWYSDEKGVEGKDAKKGYLRGVLRTIQAPLSGIMGAAETALGKGTKKGLLSNIVSNVEEGGTAGDILRTYGLPNAVTLPLGLALDIASDPFTWVTAGTSALIPRVIRGAQAGAETGLGIVKGAQIAAKSHALMKAESLGRAVPGLTKRTFDKGIVTPTTKFYKALSEKANIARGEYEVLTNKTWQDSLANSANRTDFIEKIGMELEKSKSGQKVLEHFGYKENSWLRESFAKDAEAAQTLKNLSLGEKASSLADEDLFKAEASQYSKNAPNEDLVDAMLVAEHPQLATSADDIEQTVKMKIEAKNDKVAKEIVRQDLQNIAKASGPEQEAAMKEIYHTGIKMYDDIVGKAIESPTGRKLLKSYATYISLFKLSKIGGNLLSAGTNAIVGNLTLTKMAGVDIANAGLFRSMSEAAKIVGGKNLNALDALVGGQGWRSFIAQNPETFRAIYGLQPEFVLNHTRFLQQTMEEVISKMPKGQQSNAYKEADTLATMLSDAFASGKTGKVPKIAQKGTVAAVSPVEMALKNKPTTLLTGEIYVGPLNDFLRNLKVKAETTDSVLLKGTYALLTKPMDYYGKIDQTYRLGLAMHLTKNGISEAELKILGKTFKVTEADVIKEAGRNIWKLKPEKATELASKVFMNYQAMPGFVKMMRNIPLVGAPFGSFVYGMSALTAKTAFNNPAFFNKMQLLLHEFSGSKSPLEKQALDSKYNKWMDKEGMVKLPFNQDYPVYLNMEGMIPYYTLNIFQSTDRTYGDKFGDTAAALIDSLPFWKTPEGQLIMDYAILPMITGEAQGMFGQQLYPKGATALQKAGYIGRSAVETLVPPLGGAALGAVLPEGALPYLPSFRGRELGYAKKGKSSIGAQTQENPGEKTRRVVGAIAGWPTYKINLRNQ